MRLRRYIAILMAVFCVFIAEDVDAQRRNKYQKRRSKNRAISHYKGGRISASRFRPYSFVGGSVNAVNYFGDLAPVNKFASTDISFTRPGFGVYWGRKFHHSMAIRAAFNYGRLKGDDVTADPNSPEDDDRYMRNLSFRNDIKELSVTLQIDFLPNYGGPQSRMLFNGYFFGGIAVFHHEPRGLVPEFEYQTDINNPTPVDQAGDWVKLRELGTEGQNLGYGTDYSPFQLAIPFGLGGEAFLTQQLNVGLEMGVRYLFFDHLDDVGGTYIDLNELNDSNPLSRIMSDRSLEPVAAWTGQARDVQSVVVPYFNNDIGYYVSSNLGSGVSGYGEGENYTPSIRGDKSGQKDLYFMTRITVTYMLGNSGRAKFR